MMKLLLLMFFVSVLYAGTPPKPDISAKDMKFLKLSLQVMLYNNDLENASKIIRRALQQRPDDPFWLSQAAKIALWRGETEEAKQFYLQLYRETREKNARQELSRIAHATGDQEILMFLDEKALQERYDPKIVKRVYKAYYALGYLEKGTAFFHALYHKEPHKEVAVAALLLEMEYAEFSRITEEYHRFKHRYGYNATLLYRYAKMLFAQKAYKEAYIEIASFEKELDPHEKVLWDLYTDTAMLCGHEKMLLHLLERMDAKGILPTQKRQLYLQLLTLHQPQKALAFAQKLFLEDMNKTNFYAMAYLCIRLHAWQQLEKSLMQLPPALKTQLGNDAAYYRILAQLRLGEKAYAKALKAFEEALQITPDDLSLHQAYLWALLDADDTQRLRRELQIIRNRFGQPDALAQVLALAYFRLSNSQQALQQMRKLPEKQKKKWQNLLLCADMFSLAGERERAHNILRKAYILAQKALRNNPKLLQNPSFCYDYTRLALRFHPLSRRKYLKSASKVLPQERFTELWLSSLDPQNAPQKIQSLLRRLRKPTPSQKLQLAILQGDTEKISQILEQHPSLPLPDKISAAGATENQPLYLQTLFDGMEQNPHNSNLRQTFTEAVTAHGPQATLSLAKIKRSKLESTRMRVAFTDFTQRDKRVSFRYQNERFSQKDAHTTRQNATLTLYSRFKEAKLRVEAGIIQDEHSSGILKAGFTLNHKHYGAQIVAGVQMEDDLNNELLLHGRKSGISLNSTYRYDTKRSLSLGVAYDRHFENNSSKTLGTSMQTQLYFTHYLRQGYPDMVYTLFLERQNFWEKGGHLPDDYWQGGCRVGAGEAASGQFHTHLKPYGGATLLYNTQTHLGYSLHLGTGKRLLHKDYLGIEGYYASGIGIREENYLRLQLRYLYW